MIKKHAVLSSSDIGRAVRDRRQQLDLKQMDAAGLLGVGVRFLSELERGKETLELGKVLQVIEGLGFSLTLELSGDRQS